MRRYKLPPDINVAGLFSGALLGTSVMTAIMELAQARRISRMSLPYVLGTVVSENRAVARISGTAIHFVNGIGFASGYALVFHALRRSGWRLGALLGALHGGTVLAAVLPMLQEVHPRMAEEDEGPDPTPMLEPPGLFGMNYGAATPISTVFAHTVYGAIVGQLYRMERR
jgi:hypothetical protein